MERLLYRLAQTPHHARLALKGAMLVTPSITQGHLAS
jgi:hypothetical protein